MGTDLQILMHFATGNCLQNGEHLRIAIFFLRKIKPLQNSESSACVQAEQGLREEPCNVLTPGRQSTTSWQGGCLDRDQITTQVLHFVMLGFSAVAMCHIFSRDNAYLPIVSLKYPS